MPDLRLSALWVNPAQANAHMKSVVAPWCRSQWAEGHSLQVEIRLHEDAKTDKQRNYYHGVVLEQIALQAMSNGEKYPLISWKEYFRETFLGFKTVTWKNPITGKKVRRKVRISTEELGVRGYSILIDKVTAFAVMELDVRFPMTWGEYERMQVDPDTGEILA